jgi:hypothetical protein
VQELQQHAQQLQKVQQLDAQHRPAALDSAGHLASCSTDLRRMKMLLEDQHDEMKRKFSGLKELLEVPDRCWQHRDPKTIGYYMHEIH